MVEETIQTRRKRLHMRSIRRGIKEMDVILTAYAEKYLPQMDHAAMDAYEALISEPDLDIYPWITGQSPAPPEFRATVEEIASKFKELQETSRTI